MLQTHHPAQAACCPLWLPAPTSSGWGGSGAVLASSCLHSPCLQTPGRAAAWKNEA